MDAPLLFGDWLTALGRNPRQPRGLARPRGETVAVGAVVGTVARAGDFDRRFEPLRSAARARRDRMVDAMLAGRALPPVSLIRLGELYFVEDGHHRISAARELDAVAVDAHVRAICTIAHGDASLTPDRLALKAAERDLLMR